MNWLERQNWLGSLKPFSKDDGWDYINVVKVNVSVGIGGYGIITKITECRIIYTLLYRDYKGHSREHKECFVFKEDGKYNSLYIEPIDYEGLVDSFEIHNWCSKNKKQVISNDTKTLIDLVKNDNQLKNVEKYGILHKLYQIMETFE